MEVQCSSRPEQHDQPRADEQGHRRARCPTGPSRGHVALYVNKDVASFDCIRLTLLEVHDRTNCHTAYSPLLAKVNCMYS